MKQKILLVHNYYKIPGGEDTVVENERKILEQNGHQVIFYCRSNQEMDSFPLWKKLMLPFSSVFSIKTYKEVKKLIRKEKVDIVHVHNTLTLISPSVYFAAFACKIPVIQTLHNFRLLCPAATFLREGEICEECVKKGLFCAVRHSCYRASKVQTLISVLILKIHRLLGTYRGLSYICLTEFNKEKLLSLNQKGKAIISEEKIFVKPNFIWNIQEQKCEKKEQYIYIGRLEKLKGIWVLLEAWRNFPDKPLFLCGSGPEEKRIQQYLEKYNMSQVKLTGQISHDDVFRMLRESAALILPTMCYEGMPMVILESYAAGTPVIVSDLGNAGNMVECEVTGLKFKPGNSQDLCRCVGRMSDIQKWNTKETYDKLYTPDRNYKILKEIYEKISTENMKY